MADPNGYRRLPAGSPGRLNLRSASAGDATAKFSAVDAMTKSSAGDAMTNSSAGDAMTKYSAGGAMTKSSADEAMAKSFAGDAMVNSSAPVRPYRIGAPGRLNLGSASAGDATINSSAGDATTKSSAGDAMTKSSAGDAMTNSSTPARPYSTEDSGVSIAAQQQQQQQQRVMAEQRQQHRDMAETQQQKQRAMTPSANSRDRDTNFPPLVHAPPPRNPAPAPTAAATGAMGSSSLAPPPATLAEAKTLPCADHVPLPANKLTRKSSSSILDLLPDEVIEGILLRLPAEDPKLLVHVCVVCKHWMSIVSDPAFLRRYRCFHPPPMLGFLFNHFDGEQCRDIGRFIATTSTFRPQAEELEILKHSSAEVLLDTKVSATKHALIAWDPLTQTEYCIGDFPRSRDLAASVTCAVDRCDHRHCHGAPFLVLIARTVKKGKDQLTTSVLLYSSQFDTWSERIECGELNQGVISNASTVVVATKVYFPTKDNSKILVFDMQHMTFTSIESPLEKTDGRTREILLTEDGDGRLGFWIRATFYALGQDRTLLLVVPTTASGLSGDLCA
uniref:F-box domain-containing protein n=1 Tax=Oryza punctata TaxID=4537 RepID=A0A0E0LH11_ORYPU